MPLSESKRRRFDSSFFKKINFIIKRKKIVKKKIKWNDVVPLPLKSKPKTQWIFEVLAE